MHVSFTCVMTLPWVESNCPSPRWHFGSYNTSTRLTFAKKEHIATVLQAGFWSTLWFWRKPCPTGNIWKLVKTVAWVSQWYIYICMKNNIYVYSHIFSELEWQAFEFILLVNKWHFILVDLQNCENPILLIYTYLFSFATLVSTPHAPVIIHSKCVLFAWILTT
jgi:hypothetical protein